MMASNIELIAAGVIGLGNIGVWLKVIADGRKKNNSGQQIQRQIQDHGKTIKQHETELKNIYEGLENFRAENREDHQQMFAQIRELEKK